MRRSKRRDALFDFTTSWTGYFTILHSSLRLRTLEGGLVITRDVDGGSVKTYEGSDLDSEREVDGGGTF
jgi:hypothetical protein